MDGSGNATVTGRTDLDRLPDGRVTPFQSTPGGNFDAFVTRLDSTGSSLLYSTYLGGNGDDRGFSIARDSGGNVYITGRTRSTNFPTTVGAFDTGCGSDGNCNFGFMDAYVAKLNPTAVRRGVARLLHLSRRQPRRGRREHRRGRIRQRVRHGLHGFDGLPDRECVPARLRHGLRNRLRGRFRDEAERRGLRARVLDVPRWQQLRLRHLDRRRRRRHIYVTGETFSDNFPTVSPYSGTWSGNYDVLVAKIDGATTSADLAVGKTASPDPAVVGMPLTYTVTVTNDGPDAATGVRLSTGCRSAAPPWSPPRPARAPAPW